MGKQAAPGDMFLPEDLKKAHDDGHELGCHTFGHCNSAETRPAAFEDSIVKNQFAINRLVPGVSFKTFAYPISEPLVRTKMRTARHFVCSRGCDQNFNHGVIDLNFLSSFLLEKSRDNPEAVKNVIDRNNAARGWLIFATHDVCGKPSPFGCTPGFFEEIVQYAVNSGARILPVTQALETLCSSSL
jgi:peptidoglycan/xylan/chitin deacetylase (PgdA/CDA1 family)